MDQGAYEDCLEGIKAGFSSIMIDMTHGMNSEEELDKIKELSKLTRAHGMSLEGKIGCLGGEECVTDCMKNIGQILDIHNFDSLAYGINNLTGNVLDDCIELISKNLQAIQVNASDIPLVLQNDVSIPVEVVQKVINIGVSKINVNTECQFSFAYATRKYIEANKDQQGKGYDLRKLFAPGLEEIKITVGEKMEIFRSAGKA